MLSESAASRAALLFRGGWGGLLSLYLFPLYRRGSVCRLSTYENLMQREASGTTCTSFASTGFCRASRAGTGTERQYFVYVCCGLYISRSATVRRLICCAGSFECWGFRATAYLKVGGSWSRGSPVVAPPLLGFCSTPPCCGSGVLEIHDMKWLWCVLQPVFVRGDESLWRFLYATLFLVCCWLPPIIPGFDGWLTCLFASI